MTGRTLAVVVPDRSIAVDETADKARRIVGAQLGFLGHFVVFSLTCVLLLVTAGPFPAMITAIAWGIGAASTGVAGGSCPFSAPEGASRGCWPAGRSRSRLGTTR